MSRHKKLTYNHFLRCLLHDLCDELWPTDEPIGRKVMYKHLYELTGKRHIADMQLDDLLKSIEYITDLVEKSKKPW